MFNVYLQTNLATYASIIIGPLDHLRLLTRMTVTT